MGCSECSVQALQSQSLEIEETHLGCTSLDPTCCRSQGRSFARWTLTCSRNGSGTSANTTHASQVQALESLSTIKQDLEGMESKQDLKDATYLSLQVQSVWSLHMQNFASFLLCPCWLVFCVLHVMRSIFQTFTRLKGKRKASTVRKTQGLIHVISHHRSEDYSICLVQDIWFPATLDSTGL